MLLKNSKNWRAKLISHTLQHNNVLERIIEGSIKEKNGRKWLLLEFMDQVLSDRGCKTYYNLKRKAEKQEE